MKYRTREHFEEVLKRVLAQVFDGKGIQRHGKDALGSMIPFEKQAWTVISDNVGTGFLSGQALKKMMELNAFDNRAAWEREAIGAIIYIVMAIMREEMLEGINKND